MNKKINTKKINISRLVVDSAFHMPITLDEKKSYDKIKEQVFNDTYLPAGYRSQSGETPILVDNIDAYVRSDNNAEEIFSERIRPRWDAHRILLLARNYEKMDTAILADMLGMSINTVYGKARKLGLHKHKKTADAQRIQKIKDAFAASRLRRLTQID